MTDSMRDCVHDDGTSQDYTPDLTPVCAYCGDPVLSDNNFQCANESCTFITLMNNLQKKIHENAVQKGFWNFQEEVYSVYSTCKEDIKLHVTATKLALCHSELSEALEDARNGHQPDDKIPEFSGAEVELADCIIRILDLAGGRGWRVAEAMIAKMRYNASRPYKHGKAF
jgi:hypothetical protein